MSVQRLVLQGFPQIHIPKANLRGVNVMCNREKTVFISQSWKNRGTVARQQRWPLWIAHIKAVILQVWLTHSLMSYFSLSCTAECVLLHTQIEWVFADMTNLMLGPSPSEEHKLPQTLKSLICRCKNTTHRHLSEKS